MIDARVLDVRPHPDQTTNNPGSWAVKLRVSYEGRSRTFWRWHDVRSFNENGAYVRPSSKDKPSAHDILAAFWNETFLGLHGFDFEEEAA